MIAIHHDHTGDIEAAVDEISTLDRSRVEAALYPDETIVWIGRASPLAIIWSGIINFAARVTFVVVFATLSIAFVRDKLGWQNAFPARFYEYNSTLPFDLRFVFIAVTVLLAIFSILLVWDSIKVLRLAKQHVFAITNRGGLTLIGEYPPIRHASETFKNMQLQSNPFTGRGSIFFDRRLESSDDGAETFYFRHAFLGVKDPKRVFALIKSTLLDPRKIRPRTEGAPA